MYICLSYTSNAKKLVQTWNKSWACRPYFSQPLRNISMFSLCLKGAFIVLIFLTDPGLSLLMSLQNEKWKKSSAVARAICRPAFLILTRIIKSRLWELFQILVGPGVLNPLRTRFSSRQRLQSSPSFLEHVPCWILQQTEKKKKISWNWCWKKKKMNS